MINKLQDAPQEKLDKIRLIASDVDGTLTDASLFVSESGDLSKRFSFKDIMGIALFLKKGFIFAIISGEQNNIIETFSTRLKIPEVHLGIKRKRACLEEIILKYNLTLDQVCFIGDDLNDVPALEAVGLPVIVKTANRKLKNLEYAYMTEATGGDGAIREVIDMLLPYDVSNWR